MFKHSKLTLTLLAIITALTLALNGPVLAKKGGGGGGNGGGGGGGGGDGEAAAYRVTELLPYAGGSLVLGPFAINDVDLETGTALVVAHSNDADYENYGRPIMYRVGSTGDVVETIDMTPLGYGAIARSVNCFGQVVGIGHDGETYVSFLWSIDSGLDAILGPYNSACVSARDINCFGEVAARDCNAQGVATGGRYLRLDEGNVVENIELGDFFPRKINQFGVMAGYSMDEDEMKLPAICYLDEDRIPHVTVLGWPDGFSGRAYDINNQSQVVGYQRALNPEGVWSSRAFLWSVADGMRDLGDLGGGYATAWAIDEAGEVTGESVVRKRNGSLVPRAFVWRDGVMSDLNELSDTNFTLMRAYAMNNDGQIVVEGHDRTGKKALLLTPTAP